ncbi:MAG: response regulator [Pseudomonadota bacterium]
MKQSGTDPSPKPASPDGAEGLAPPEGLPAATERLLRRRADGVLAGQKEALELVLGGASTVSILGVLARTVEVQCEPGTLATILWLDEDEAHLRHGAGGSLPTGFLRALDGLDIGPAAGPCGAALQALEPVGSADLDTARDLWPAFRTLALAHGLHACWAAPILGVERRALGVLALFRREPCHPGDEDVETALEIVHTAALVLERERAERRRLREERHRDDFLATLVHELRNPLAPLANAIELLGRAGSDAALVGRVRSMMSRQLAQLARLVDELADLSHSVSATRFAPLEPDEAPAVQLPLPTGSETVASGLAARRVLVADDNDLVRESFVELLKSEGYDVRTAADGLQAVELAEQWRPQVVLLDIHMPRLSGLEAARRLRAAHPPQAMTLLMMSGMTLNEAWIRHAKAAGFDDCLDKTADPRAWLARVRELAMAASH